LATGLAQASRLRVSKSPVFRSPRLKRPRHYRAKIFATIDRMHETAISLHMIKSRISFLMVLSWLFWVVLAFVEPSDAQTLPARWPGEWKMIGRTKIQPKPKSIIISGGYAVGSQVWRDAEISFRARAPRGTKQVQIWAGFRCRDRDSRYVFALRGGHDNDIYLARYAPDGQAEFLGFAPLDFKPVPGIWYRLRVVMLGDQFQIYLNDEKLPRLNVADHEALWHEGRVCLGGGWLPTEFADLQVKPLTAQDQTAFRAIGDQHWTAPEIDKETLRRKQRAGYVPVEIGHLNPLRTKISLDGNWLFMPDYELPAGQTPVQLDYDDQNWHVMPVPSFWTPGLSWLHGETSFTNLSGLSITKGVAESLYVRENERCDNYTFDWRKTRAAWYRQYVNLPSTLENRHFELTFDAIAKVSEIWVNGIEVGTHTGMFGQVKCNATKAIRPGRNVIAVHVIGQPDASKGISNKTEGVAVTVEVTSAMLNSLPHGMFQDDVSGIWQPVKLTVTAPISVSDCFIEPGLHGADINLDIRNAGAQSANVNVDYLITSAQDGSVLYSDQLAKPFLAAAGRTGRLKFATPHLNPKLWSPQDPNLYYLEVRLKERGKDIDTYKVRFGFRTFAVSGNKFLLNGKPYWLRGADPFPNTLRPNDKKLARRFMEIARAGNVCVTRTHIVPFTTTWLNAADQVGMAVSLEGTWPWLMLRGNPPDEKLLKIWKDGFISLIHEYRNHPSIILWTVNNEMKFEQRDQNKPALLRKKWLILNDAIKAMRQADPTRPVIADSSYVRKETRRGYNTLVKPEHLDDGDADDAHRYYGWYDRSFFHLNDGEFWDPLTTPGRPLISQEMSTGYPNNDDGHPTRFYLFKNYTPQALVGDEAWENADPAIFLKRQAFMTKELTETLRRTGQQTGAGVLLFSYFTWFQSPWSAAQIKPWPTYDALKTALQPVLVSAELYGRHFYAGSTIHRRVCVINDSENWRAIPGSQLIWEFTSAGKILSQGRMDVPPVDYYSNLWLNAAFAIPRSLPSPRTDGRLVLKLEADGKVLSENHYDVTLATRDWTDGEFDPKTKIFLWNPGMDSTDVLSGLKVVTLNSPAAVPSGQLLVVGKLSNVTLTANQITELREFVSKGGRVLMLHPGAALVKLFPNRLKSFVPKQGEIVTMHIPESPVFSGIEPLDLAWFDRGDRRLPIACAGVYQLAAKHAGITALASQCDPHGYLHNPSDVTKFSGAPFLEVQSGKGRLLASELCFESGATDPIARRLLMNSLHYLHR
jgi:Glycosyl hydrolases family 2/Glycosyl hydrolase 2 galactose-binding domain-like/Glycosyl hydrolases family 2, TIM barrel domain